MIILFGNILNFLFCFSGVELRRDRRFVQFKEERKPFLNDFVIFYHEYKVSSIQNKILITNFING